MTCRCSATPGSSASTTAPRTPSTPYSSAWGSTTRCTCSPRRYDGRKQRRQYDDGEYEAHLQAWLRGGAGVILDGVEVGEVWTRRVAVDPSASSFRTLLRNRGWSGLVPADNSVLDGIRALSLLLSAGRLKFVQSAAPELERELLGMVWDPRQQEEGIDAPLKVDDHGPDALRYGVMAPRSTWRDWVSAD